MEGGNRLLSFLEGRTRITCKQLTGNGLYDKSDKGWVAKFKRHCAAAGRTIETERKKSNGIITYTYTLGLISSIIGNGTC